MKTTIQNEQVTLPITTRGDGQKLLFIGGVGTTQIAWKKVIARLRGHYETITFDLRGHGKASKAKDYSFSAFLSDTETVLKAVGSDRPILVAWSLGADLALRYTAEHADSVAGLVLIDGAIPIREGLIGDRVAMRRSLKTPSVTISMLLMRVTPYRYALSPDNVADIAEDVDDRRQHGLLAAYGHVDCPITMMLATRTSQARDVARANRSNRVWREGAEHLAVAYPKVQIQWQDSSHLLPFTKPTEIAALIDEFATRINAAPR